MNPLGIPRLFGGLLALSGLLLVPFVEPSRPSLDEQAAQFGGMTRRRIQEASSRFRGGGKDADQLPLPEYLGVSRDEYASLLEAKGADFNWALPSSAWRWDRYHNSDDVKELLHFLAARWPQIATVQMIGKSVENRELWVITIGSQAARDAAVPSDVQLIGNMHGDETASAEILLRFAWDLCRRYGQSEDELGVTRLLDTTVLHILPTMNPDGYDAKPRTRNNAQGVDLNRAFPRMGSTAPKNKWELRLVPDFPHGQPPEVSAVMNWTQSNDFILSVNLHGGALVACFPLDSCDVAGFNYDCPTPEDPTPYHLARAIADKHFRMKNSPDFADGVIRGSEWYPVLGGMQDWIWYSTNTISLTVEVHQEKEPRDEFKRRQPYLYWEMRDPLLNFATSAHHSIKGHVLDGQTSTPLGAKIFLVGFDRNKLASSGRVTSTSPTMKGRYTRVMVPGSAYCLLAKADGYVPSVALVQLNQSTPRDAAASIQYDIRLRTAGGNEPYSEEVMMLGDASGTSPSRSSLSPSSIRRMSAKCAKLLTEDF